MRVKKADPPVAVEPPRVGENVADCPKCHAPDEAYIWVNENWRVRSMDRPSGLPMVLILESRSHLDLGDLPNMLAAELGVMTVRLERAIRSIDGVARVHVNRWGDGAAHLHLWFLARPYGRLQLRGTFLTLWDEILPPIPEYQWRENLALVAAWLAEFGGEPLARPPHIDWKAPASFSQVIQQTDGGPSSSEYGTQSAESDPPQTEDGTQAEARQPPPDAHQSTAPEAEIRSNGSDGSAAASRANTGTPAGPETSAQNSGAPAGAAAGAPRDNRNPAQGQPGDG